MDLFKEILLSPVYDVAVETPLDFAKKISAKLNNAIYLKREDLQPVFSFKLRGAYHRIKKLTSEERQRGVICASAGNHAQGVAYSCQLLKLDSLVIMPRTTPKIKVEAVKQYGSQVILHGDSYSEAGEYCKQLAIESGRVFIHPFEDPAVIAGQGTIGLELLRALPEVDYIFVPIGGGGLISGIATYIKHLKPNVKIIGVEPKDSCAMKNSIELGVNTALDEVGIFADGVAVKKVGDLNFAITKELVDDIVVVGTDEICSALKITYEEIRTLLEPAGALALSGAIKWIQESKIENQKIICINSGANMNFQRLPFVAERTLTGEGKEALFAIQLKETPGSLSTLCKEVLADINITEFNYRMKDKDEAYIFLGIEIENKKEKQSFINKLESKKYLFHDLTENELAKLHVRHMVGGVCALAKDEVLYRFVFPERRHALEEFLEKMSQSWNISLFHYRSQGSDYGRVLLGMQVPQQDRQEFEKCLKDTHYGFEDETNNSVFHLFLKGSQ